MKRIISVLLVLATSLSLLVGCTMNTGNNPTVSPQPDRPLTTQPDLDCIDIVGMFYRAESGHVVLLSKEIGPIVLHNDVSDFDDIIDFAIIKAEAEIIMESYPAQTTIKNWEVINPVPVIDDYKDMVDTMIELGYKPVTIFDEGVVYLYITPYKTITTIVDTLAEENNNTMFSPLSLNFALGMVANGANEEFEKDFENYFGITIEDYNNYVKCYSQNVSPDSGETIVDIANSIWVQKPLVLQDKFAELMTVYYNAEVYERNFDKDFVKEVNQWCAEKTHDMIPEVLGEPPMSQTILINALYFDGKWDSGYEDYQVGEEEFTTDSGEIVIVDGMRISEETFYMENEYATAFAKYYKDGRYAFVGILPKNEGDFNLVDLDLESLMNAERMEFVEVSSMIPKFDFKNSHTMIELLEKIGLPVTQMTFSNITNNQDLYIDNIMQHTAVEVTEKGTRASAVTVVEMDSCVAPEEEMYKEVVLNRPFAFMIYDMENQTPLFIGKVTNPKA